MKKFFKPIGFIFIVFLLCESCSKKSDVQPAPLPVCNIYVSIVPSTDFRSWLATVTSDKPLYGLDLYLTWQDNSSKFIYKDTIFDVTRYSNQKGGFTYAFDGLQHEDLASYAINIKVLGLKDYYHGYTYKY
jgi:hypothetical protein